MVESRELPRSTIHIDPATLEWIRENDKRAWRTILVANLGWAEAKRWSGWMEIAMAGAWAVALLLHLTSLPDYDWSGLVLAATAAFLAGTGLRRLATARFQRVIAMLKGEIAGHRSTPAALGAFMRFERKTRSLDLLFLLGLVLVLGRVTRPSLVPHAVASWVTTLGLALLGICIVLGFAYLIVLAWRLARQLHRSTQGTK